MGFPLTAYVGKVSFIWRSRFKTLEWKLLAILQHLQLQLLLLLPFKFLSPRVCQLLHPPFLHLRYPQQVQLPQMSLEIQLSTLPSQDPPAPVLSPTPVPTATPTSNADPLSTTPSQQSVPSQNPPSAASSPTPIHIVTSGTLNSHATPVSSEQPPRTNPIGTKLWASRSLIFSLVIVGLVDGLTLSAPSTKSPLGSISNTNGILILSILATLTGYSLSAAAKTVWDRAPFRLLAKEQSSGLSLIVFWTLTSGVGGSCLILWREFCKLLRRNSNSNNPQGNTRAHSDQRVRGHPKLWSALR